jgi:hypothetical protein
VEDFLRVLIRLFTFTSFPTFLRRPPPPAALSSEETVWASSFLTLVILVIGTITIIYQCRQLLERIQQIRQKGGRGVKQEEEAVVCGKELREAQQTIQQTQRQSYQDLANELESMRVTQKEVKSNLAGLQTLVERASEQKQRRTADIDSNAGVDAASKSLIIRAGHDKDE